jgi:hypothetical protein
MAKATVSMVLRSTGFGNKAPLLGVPRPKRQRSSSPHHSRSTSTNSMPGLISQYSQGPSHSPYFQQPSSDFAPYRPPNSHFQLEPNLRELFPEDTPESQRFRTVRWGVGQQPRNLNNNNNNQSNGSNGITTYHNTPMHSPASTSLSLGSPASPSDPTSLSHQNAQTSNSQFVSTHNNNSSSDLITNPRTSQRAPHQQIPSTASLQSPGTYANYALTDLQPTTSYLAHPTINPNLNANNTNHGNPNPNLPPVSVAAPGYDSTTVGFQNDLDFLLADPAISNGAYMATSGMSLGFDTDHDWNDGTGPDLFDGYWFRAGWGGSVSGLSGLVNPDGGNGEGLILGSATPVAGEEWDGMKDER